MGTCPQCGFEGELGATCPQHPACCLADPLQLEEYAGEPVLLGQILLDRFALVRVLGKGGMGWVYEAVQLPIGRHVALKILRADYVDDKLVRKRFFREARALGMLQHPNLVTLFDYGMVQLGEDESLFIAMELLRGRTLTSALLRPRAFGAARALAALRGIAAGLADAHRAGIVHRDLKPDNILLVRDARHREVAKVVDFGIARLSTTNTVLTQAGMVFGTPAYMSPEQAAGETNIGPGADVYAFGVLLYRVLAGKLPFTGDTPLQVLMKHMNKPTPPLALRPGLEVPGALLELTYHCLQKHPSERPKDAAELERCLGEITVELQEGVGLIAGPALEDVSSPDLDTGNSEVDDGDTWVVGGEFTSGGDTSPSGPQGGSSKAPLADDATQGALPRAAAYRVNPNDIPSALREAGRIDLRPFVIGGVVLVVLAIIAAVVLFSGDDGDAPADSADEAQSEGKASPEPKARAKSGDRRRQPEMAAESDEAADPVAVDDEAVDTADALLTELRRLRLARETAMTIVDREERTARQNTLQKQITAVEGALEQLGIVIPPE